jgi:hypothetical protein
VKNYTGTSLYIGDPYAVYFNTGENTTHGYVARWMNIQPGSYGSFKVRAQSNDSVCQSYAYDMFTRQEKASSGSTIMISGTLTTFSTPVGIPSAAQTYTVSSTFLIDNILITPPSGFELLTDSEPNPSGCVSLQYVITKFTLVNAYYASDTGDPWKNYDRLASFGNDLKELVPDWGFWVKVGGDHTWEVSY